MASQVYCTYFDHNYLSRGFAMYHSLRRHVPDARLWVLCLSDACHRALLKLDLPDLTASSLADFEAADPEVAATRSTRNAIEYYFTCTPAWLASCATARRTPSGSPISTAISTFQFSRRDLRRDAGRLRRHHAPPLRAEDRKDGEIRNLQCRLGQLPQRPRRPRVIEWWRGKCIEWCYDYVDAGRFADQGYLDAFPRLSPRVKSLEHPGVNLAPWNIGNHGISMADGEVSIDGKWPLIFFHFQGLRRDLGPFFFTSHRRHGAQFPATVPRAYLQALCRRIAGDEVGARGASAGGRVHARPLRRPAPRRPEAGHWRWGPSFGSACFSCWIS